MRIVNSPQLFKVVNGVQKSIRYFYVVLISLMIYTTVSGFLLGERDWVNPAIRIFTAIELFLAVLYFGIIICIKVFDKVDGDLLGTDVDNIIEFWGWFGDKIRDMLVYNGIIGFMLFSMYL